MPRESTGTAPVWSAKFQAWCVRARIPANTGPRKLVPILGARDAAHAAKLAPAVIEGRRKEFAEGVTGVPKDPGLTFEKYAEQWMKARDEKGYTSVRVDRSALKIHVTPILGAKAMRAITADDVRAVVERLDEKIDADELSAKYAANVWACLHKLFRDACRSKRNALRVLSSNPTADVEGPDHGSERLKAYLYPSEYLALATCPAVPVDARRWYTCQLYLMLRPGELGALECEDVDLVHDAVHVHRALDWKAGTVKETKTGRDRRIPIEPALRPLLEQIIAERGKTGRLFPEVLSDANNASAALREHLRAAGVERKALFDSDRTRRAIRLYDLRATGITWAAIRGDEGVKIQWRAGHSDFRMTQVYIREADVLRAGFGDVFPAVPSCVIGPDRTPGGMGALPIASISEDLFSGRDRDRMECAAEVARTSDRIPSAPPSPVEHSTSETGRSDADRTDRSPVDTAREALAEQARALIAAGHLDAAESVLAAARKLGPAPAPLANVVPFPARRKEG